MKLADEITESRCKVELVMDVVRWEVELAMDVVRWEVEFVTELFKLKEDDRIKDAKEDSRKDVEFWMVEIWCEEEARVTDSR